MGHYPHLQTTNFTGLGPIFLLLLLLLLELLTMAHMSGPKFQVPKPLPDQAGSQQSYFELDSPKIT